MTDTVLLVDDEANIIAALRRLLRPDGYRLLSATNSAEGLELLRTQKVSVIVSDERMPGLSGTELLRLVQRLYPETVRIILSAYRDGPSNGELLAAEVVHHFIAKPWDNESLRSDLQCAVRRHRALRGSPPAARDPL
jgi:response regulator RpfG family c-di-GMP phosphodiesterase